VNTSLPLGAFIARFRVVRPSKVPISMISLPGVLAAAACANTPSSLSRTLPLRFCVSTR
jgi:hypothetical protein